MKKSDNLPKYSMVFTYRIFRVEDATEVANVFRGFRGNSIEVVLGKFKRIAAREKAQKRERKA